MLDRGLSVLVEREAFLEYWSDPLHNRIERLWGAANMLLEPPFRSSASLRLTFLIPLCRFGRGTIRDLSPYASRVERKHCNLKQKQQRCHTQ